MESASNLFLLVIVYITPAILAYALKSQRFKLVFWVNLLTAWTLVGWVACLAWAIVKAKPALTKEEAEGQGLGAKSWQTKSIAKRSSLLIVGLLVAPVFALAIYSVANPDPAMAEKMRTERQAKAEAKRIEKEAKEAQNAAEMERISKIARARTLVKMSAKNPDSVDFEMEFISPHNPDAVCVVYRATNSFNAVVPGVAVVINKSEVRTDAATIRKNCN